MLKCCSVAVRRFHASARLCDTGPWKATGITDAHGLIGAVVEAGANSPTPTQMAAIPHVLARKDTFIVAQTGSGKTLSFLLPIAQMLKVDELEHGVATRNARPRALVLTASRELAHQTTKVVKSLGHHARLASACVTSGTPRSKQIPQLQRDVDVVVATPGRLLRYVRNQEVYLSDVQHVVIDEADTVLGPEFGDEVERLLRPVLKRKAGDDAVPPQVVLVAASAVGAVRERVSAMLPDVEVVESQAHVLPAGLRTVNVRVSGTMSAKGDALRSLLAEHRIDGRPGGDRTLMFCNSIQSARALGHLLAEHGVAYASLHGDIPQRRRASEFDKFHNGTVSVLVCTDAAARGLDVDVSHVVLFDFPRDLVAYLHRVGRTARAGAPGRATCFVGNSDVKLAQRVEAATAARKSVLSTAPNRRARPRSAPVKPKRVLPSKRRKQDQQRFVKHKM